MEYWFLNKNTQAAEIFGSLSSIIKHEKLQKTEYKSRLYECFSRKKLNKFEDDNYRIERREPIRARRVNYK